MQTELKYQARKHAISNKPREKKILQILPKKKNFFIFLFLLKTKTTSNMEKTSYAKA
jgi:hypothetical protein